MSKKYLSVAIGLVLIFIGLVVFRFMNGKSEIDTGTEAEQEVLAVKVKSVVLMSYPYEIEATGLLEAKEKIELYSEVQGVLLRTKKAFKLGNGFRKGQTLIAMDSKEHAAQINTNRSDLMNQIAAMLPDMEIDYPHQSQKWETYLENLNMTSLTPELPPFSSNEEKLFISGKSIYRTFYTIKNLEERLGKYSISAPFNGVVTESNANVGSLIRSGQKIGEFIDNSRFELQLSVPALEHTYTKVGAKVDLQLLDGSKSFRGSINRINGKINQSTQSVSVIVEVVDSSLKDGQYLKAQLKGDDLNNVFKIDSSLLLENSKIYVVEEGMLELRAIQVLNYQGDFAIIDGLENGNLILNERVANAYPGMPVKTLN